MNRTIFQSSRFQRLIRAYFNENGKLLIRALIAYAIITLVIWLIITFILIGDGSSFNAGVQLFMFSLSAFIAPILAAGWFYGRLNKPERQISFLVVPATHFEKHILSTLMSIVIPFAIGILTYFIGEVISMQLHSLFAVPNYWREIYATNFDDVFHGKPLIAELLETKIPALIVFVYFSFAFFGAAFFQFFSLHFTRYVLFKIVLLSVCLFTFIMTFCYIVLESLNISENTLFSYIRYLFRSTFTNNGNDSEVLLFAIPALVSALALWYAGYIRLKEYQIN